NSSFMLRVYPSSILLLVFVRLLHYSYPLFAGIASAPPTPATLTYGCNPRSLSMAPCGRRKDISRLQSFGCLHRQGLFFTFSPCLLFCSMWLVCGWAHTRGSWGFGLFLWVRGGYFPLLLVIWY